ncbi:hypothetical protein N9235_03215 [Gammaproteobacteria bacterium]|nr:hypothetical protein [Gammaproteobacteria bacterium]
MKEKVVCNTQPQWLDSIRLWREALEGRNKDMAYELMNQVLDGKIKYEAALALLASKHD